MIDVFEQVDRLVGIMNGFAYKNGKYKDVELINLPVHRHIEDLFVVVEQSKLDIVLIKVF